MLERSSGRRVTSSPSEPTSTAMMKARKNGPRVDSPKACTEEMIPERVRKVPKKQRLKVRITSTMFQIFSIPRRSCIITECRNAVATARA